MQQKHILLVLFILFFKLSFSQITLSEKAEISIVTAGSGTELYEAFGHSAIRIKDINLDFDIIYNYGMFDFNAPNFYGNFTKGKLLYQLARYDFKYFLRSYKKDKRWVKQQVLNLNQNEKQAFFDYLEINALPKNRNYFYDPFFNNCASKLRDITTTILKDDVVFYDNHLEKKVSFRTLMNREIPWNTWGSFGINIALGSKLDQMAKPLQYMYLPDYVYEGFNNAKLHSKDLIKRKETLINFTEIKQKSSFFNPFTIFLVFSVIGIFITYKDVKRKRRTKILDFLIFFSTGILGCIIVFLWFFTDHSTTPNNFNFLWAFAPNLVVAFLLLKKKSKKWLLKYISLVIILLVSIPVIWLLKIQVFHKAMLPILMLMLIRFFYLIKYLLPSKI